MFQNFNPTFFDRNILRAIVCGYERGGTTLISQILCTHPMLDSGFESGLLLANEPKQYLDDVHSDFNDYIIKESWGIDQNDLEYILGTKKWESVYRRLRCRAEKIKNKKTYLFDKTPKYMLHLNDVLNRIDKVPCIVVIKEPRGVIYSWLKRHPDINISSVSEQLIKDCCKRYEDYARGYNLANSIHSTRILRVDYEQLCLHPKKVTKKIFDHLGLKFTDDNLFFEQKYEVYGNTVSHQYLNEYEGALNPSAISMIDEHAAAAVSLLSV
jgi:hypothetical protein